MKGGASMVEGQTLINFLNKATEIKVLTDNSISSLTLKITGPKDIYKNKLFTAEEAPKEEAPKEEAPKEEAPASGGYNDITTILVKLLPTKSYYEIKKPLRACLKTLYKPGMHIVDEIGFYQEIITSINVYFSTLEGKKYQEPEGKKYQEPVCPAILEYFYEQKTVIDDLINLIDEKKKPEVFKERDLKHGRIPKKRKPNSDPEYIKDREILHNMLESYNPAIIVMEFLEDYITLEQYIKENKDEVPFNTKTPKNFALCYTILYQINRMTKYSKIEHEDLHKENIMIKRNWGTTYDNEIEEDEVQMTNKIKKILNDPEFKIDIKIIDFGMTFHLDAHARNYYLEELYISGGEKLFIDLVKLTLLQQDEFDEVITILDSKTIKNLKMNELKYHDVYERVVDIRKKDEESGKEIEKKKRIEKANFEALLSELKNAAVPRNDVANGRAEGFSPEGNTARLYKFLEFLDHGKVTLQSRNGKFIFKVPPERAVGGKGGGKTRKNYTKNRKKKIYKKSKKNKKRKGKFRSKKNKK